MKNKVFPLAGAIIILFIAGYLFARYRIAPEIKFESLILSDLEDRPVSLDRFRDKMLFINFFATWCGPCLQELPSLESAQRLLANENFQFILISDEPSAQLKNFREQTGDQFLILHSENKLREKKIFTLPTSYLLNMRREIVFKKTGADNWASEQMIEKFKTISKNP